MPASELHPLRFSLAKSFNLWCRCLIFSTTQENANPGSVRPRPPRVLTVLCALAGENRENGASAEGWPAQPARLRARSPRVRVSGTGSNSLIPLPRLTLGLRPHRSLPERGNSVRSPPRRLQGEAAAQASGPTPWAQPLCSQAGISVAWPVAENLRVWLMSVGLILP